nr:zinc finger BED domain-containing protein RICESLEEPER 2 [Tanacetum cinerariifolium]
MFPVLSRMAMDLISVQATSVASEFAFSTSRRVLSIRRTRLTPASLKMCMCLKDYLDAIERIQHTSSHENTLDFEEEILDEEVQQNEAVALSDKEIVLDEAASKARHEGYRNTIEIPDGNDVVPLQSDSIRQTIDQAAGGKLRDKNDEESWALLEDLALYDNKSWNDPRDFDKPVKAISMPQDVRVHPTIISLSVKIKSNA